VVCENVLSKPVAWARPASISKVANSSVRSIGRDSRPSGFKMIPHRGLAAALRPLSIRSLCADFSSGGVGYIIAFHDSKIVVGCEYQTAMIKPIPAFLCHAYH